MVEPHGLTLPTQFIHNSLGVKENWDWEEKRIIKVRQSRRYRSKISWWTWVYLLIKYEFMEYSICWVQNVSDDSTFHNWFLGKSLVPRCYCGSTILIDFKCHCDVIGQTVCQWMVIFEAICTQDMLKAGCGYTIP